MLAGVDNDKRLKETYTYNNNPSRFINKDINKIKIGELREELGIQNGDTTLYAACTPCQPFSTLSRLKDKDGKKILLLAFAKIVKESPPDFILVENVPGLNSACGKEIYEEFLEVLEDCEFSDPAADLLDAKTLWGTANPKAVHSFGIQKRFNLTSYPDDRSKPVCDS